MKVTYVFCFFLINLVCPVKMHVHQLIIFFEEYWNPIKLHIFGLRYFTKCMLFGFIIFKIHILNVEPYMLIVLFNEFEDFII